MDEKKKKKMKGVNENKTKWMNEALWTEVRWSLALVEGWNFKGRKREIHKREYPVP